MGSLYSDDPTWLHAVPAGFKLAFLALLGTGVFLMSGLIALSASAAFCLLAFLSLGRAVTRAKPLLTGLVFASGLIGLFHIYMQQPMVGHQRVALAQHHVDGHCTHAHHTPHRFAQRV